MVYVQMEPRSGTEPPWSGPPPPDPPWKMEPAPAPDQPRPKEVTLEGARGKARIVSEAHLAPPPPPPRTELPIVRSLLSRPYRDAPPSGPFAPGNYAAVEVHGLFGLIDRGSPSPGVRSLLAHTLRGAPPDRLQGLRVGDTMTVRTRGDEEERDLRVRYLTPARYYAPGRRITMLGVGVDDRAWARLALVPAGRDQSGQSA